MSETCAGKEVSAAPDEGGSDDTIHYEVIVESSAHALQLAALAARVPVINGIVVAENEQQARDRCLERGARGAEFAWSALEMAALKDKPRPAG